ncbi:MAG: sigma-70 family RNA polymerase sigma factor [Planctomycetales bacterium]|nr:sigma-70 family RNA polymerase sigma factor [Planctomycetales bacterium]
MGLTRSELAELLITERNEIIRIRRTKGTRFSRRFDSEDIYQETCLKLLRAGPEACRAKSSSEAKHWVRTAAANTHKTAITRNMAEKRSVRRELTDAIQETLVPEQETDPRLNEIPRWLDSIDERHAKVMRLFYFDRLSHLQIGRQLGISVFASRALLSRGLKSIRRIIAEDECRD